MQDRAAAGSDGVDQHHRRTHAHAGHFGLEGAFIFAVEMRDVGGGSAHVKADDAVETCGFTGLGKTDDTAGRTGEDRVLALEHLGRGEAARRHHEHDARAGAGDIEFARDLGDVAAENR
ncbi:hypothetical protein D9M72_516470 [compost metagenome]